MAMQLIMNTAIMAIRPATAGGATAESDKFITLVDSPYFPGTQYATRAAT